jgi:hypothetical protein
MNERIKEFAEQATSYMPGRPPYDDFFDKEKFAKLIVKECGDWIVNNAGAIEHLGPLHFAKAMQKDFGVEE